MQRFRDHDFAVAKFVGSKKGAAEVAPAAGKEKKKEGAEAGKAAPAEKTATGKAA